MLTRERAQTPFAVSANTTRRARNSAHQSCAPAAVTFRLQEIYEQLHAVVSVSRYSLSLIFRRRRRSKLLARTITMINDNCCGDGWSRAKAVFHRRRRRRVGFGLYSLLLFI